MSYCDLLDKEALVNLVDDCSSMYQLMSRIESEVRECLDSVCDEIVDDITSAANNKDWNEVKELADRADTVYSFLTN